MTNYYTSDPHYFHKNIIKYSNRPFNSVDEMNAAMIKNWNSVVQPNDTGFILGDFAFNNDSEWILHKLNGKKILIWGNHDSNVVKKFSAWEQSLPYLEINDNGQFLVLFHYGCRVWNKSHHGAIQLYGHSHGTLPGNNQSLDVGVDCWNYTPCNLSQIKARLKTLPAYKAQDRHGED